MVNKVILNYQNILTILLVSVKFGSKIGKIVELNDNLITVVAPKTEKEEVVIVDVANKYGTETVTATNKLTFTYVYQ